MRNHILKQYWFQFGVRALVAMRPLSLSTMILMFTKESLGKVSSRDIMVKLRDHELSTKLRGNILSDFQNTKFRDKGVNLNF